MTTCEVDLSKSEVLIDEIQKIFKPPSDDSSVTPRLSKNANKSNYNNCDGKYKDPGSSSNTRSSDDYDPRTAKNWKKPRPNSHDYCDSCSTFEGERLVCDRCPASFHLVCLDPPVDYEDAPIGVWYCNRCTAIMKEEDDKNSNLSGTSLNKLEADDITETIGASNTINKRSESSISSEITAEMSDDLPNKKLRLSSQGTKSLTALNNVIDVLQCLNPKEFDLPKHLIPSIKLPGSFKSPGEMRNKTVISLENGVIPKPVVNCFDCSRTCFYGTLVKCDYCSRYYHLDCLDPPLIQLPSRVERWMCPNHIEQVIDRSGMIKTIRLSERIKMYDDVKNKLSDVNEFEVISELSSGAGFRLGTAPKVEKNDTEKVKVPDIVKQMYKEAKNKPKKDINVTISEEQNTLLQAIFNVATNNKDFDVRKKCPTEILEQTLESVKTLVAEKRIDLNVKKVHNSKNVKGKPGNEKIKCRALLFTMVNETICRNIDPLRMTYRHFTFGSSEDNDCVISGCQYVSPRHASICYVDNHFCYELINYSRYGSVVDKLIYYNDIAPKEAHKSIHPAQHIKDIRNMIYGKGKSANSHHRRSHSSKNRLPLMSAQRDMDKPAGSCTCGNYGYGQNVLNKCVENGWESSAPLKFGSIIEIGCKQFIFTSAQEVHGPANMLGGLLNQSNNTKFDSFERNSSQNSFKLNDSNDTNIVPTTTYTRSTTTVQTNEMPRTTANVTKIPLIPLQKAKNIQIKNVKRAIPHPNLTNKNKKDRLAEYIGDGDDEGDFVKRKTKASTIFSSTSTSSLIVKDAKFNKKVVNKPEIVFNKPNIDDDDDDDDLDIIADEDEDNDSDLRKREL